MPVSGYRGPIGPSPATGTPAPKPSGSSPPTHLGGGPPAPSGSITVIGDGGGGGTTGGGAGGSGGGTSSTTGFGQYFKVQPPWATGIGPFPSVYQAANWIRAKFQLMMGDLSGWAYNSLIVKGGTVQLQVLPGTNPILPSGAWVVVGPMYGPSGDTINVGNSPNQAPAFQLPASGALTLYLDAVMNVTYQYTLNLSIRSGSTLSDPAYETVTLMDTGNVLYGGIPETITLPPLVYGGRITVHVTKAGTPASGILITFAVVDTTAAETLTWGTAMSLADGDAVYDFTTAFPADDAMTISIQYNLPEGPKTSLNTTGAVLGDGVTLSLDIGGETTKGSANSVLFQLQNSNGTAWTGGGQVIVGLGPNVNGGQVYITAPNSSAVVAIQPAWLGQRIVYGWGAGSNGTGGSQYGSIGMDQVLTASSADISDGTAVQVINVQDQSAPSGPVSPGEAPPPPQTRYR